MKRKVKILASLGFVMATTFLTSGSVLSSSYPKENFTNVFSFGGSFTAPDNSWAAGVTEKYGFSFVKYNNNISKANNFAKGGADASRLNIQLDHYIDSVGKVDPHALYMMYVGPNDMEKFYTSWYQDVIYKQADLTSHQLQTSQEDVHDNIQNFVERLSSDGAQYILISNHFNEYYRQENLIRGRINVINNFISIRQSRDLQTYPFLNDPKALGQFIAEKYNQAIYEGVSQVSGANVIYQDINKLVQEISDDPTAYLSEADINGTYNNWGLFDNSSHPTNAAHKILSQYTTSLIESPSQVALLREVPISVGNNILNSIRSVILNTYRAEKPYEAQANINYIYSHTGDISKKGLGIKNSNTINTHARVDYQLDDNIDVGFQLNGSGSRTYFKNGRGKADIREYLASVNVVYKFDGNPVFIYAAAGGGQIKYHIKRQVILGLKNRIEHGKPSGVHCIGTVGVGYNYLHEDVLSVTPFLNANYQHVSMKRYRERDDNSTTMEFNIPKRKSLIAEAGINISKKHQMREDMAIISSISLSYSHEFIKTIKKQAVAQLVSMPASFKMPTYNMNKSYFNAGGELGIKTNSSFNYGVRASAQLNKNIKQYSAGIFANVSL